MSKGINVFVACIFTMQTVIACSGGAKNEWDDLDYSSVYRRAGERENDPGYRAPSNVGCLEEELCR